MSNPEIPDCRACQDYRLMKDLDELDRLNWEMHVIDMHKVEGSDI